MSPFHSFDELALLFIYRKDTVWVQTEQASSPHLPYVPHYCSEGTAPSCKRIVSAVRLPSEKLRCQILQVFMWSAVMVAYMKPQV